MTIERETKSWTWVLERPCDECGFDATDFPRHEIGRLCRAAAEPWPGFLAHPLARVRPRDDCWSALEYGCHVRDVFRLGVHRVGRMLREDNRRFDNWDQDETAVTERYDLQDPIVVADELAEAASAFADQYDHVGAQQWSRSGLRSDGFSFTVESFGRYFLHDPAHHIVDVRRGFDHPRARASSYSFYPPPASPPSRSRPGGHDLGDHPWTTTSRSQQDVQVTPSDRADSPSWGCDYGGFTTVVPTGSSTRCSTAR